MPQIDPIRTAPRCFQCGGKLVLVSQKTSKTQGERFPVTTVIYKCADKTCQADIDKKTQGRIKLREEQEEAKKKRIKATGRFKKKS